MTFVFELRGLLFGLLTATTIAAITSLSTRAVKLLLPAPANLNRRRLHIDSRDALANLIVSFEIIPSLLKGLFVCRALRNKRPPPPLSKVLWIVILFLVTGVFSMISETTLILSTGAVSTILHVPDVSPFSFVTRQIVEDGHRLPALRNSTLSRRNCIENDRTFHDGSVYASYEQRLCVDIKKSKVPANKTLPSSWTLRTMDNKIDKLSLWVGEVSFVTGNHKMYTEVFANIIRRVNFDHSNSIRVLNPQTARIMYRAVLAVFPPGRCNVNEALDVPIDRNVHDRPASIANFTCIPPLTVLDVQRALIPGILAGYGDGLGVAAFAVNRRFSKNIYPDVGLLSIMFDLSQHTEWFVNEIYRTPVVLRARATAGIGLAERNVHYGFLQRNDSQEVPLHAVSQLSTDHYTFR
eukprot:IDg7467t1